MDSILSILTKDEKEFISVTSGSGYFVTFLFFRIFISVLRELLG